MALQKQPLNINFAKGLDTKSDPWQVAVDNFLSLNNSIFTKAGLLSKRNGYTQLANLPLAANSLATFRSDLLALGDSIQTLTNNNTLWINKGPYTQATLSTQSLVRTATSQTTADTAINGSLSCSVWIDSDGSNYYQICDASTGQPIVESVQLPTTSTLPQVFALGNWFIVTYIDHPATTFNLMYVAIGIGAPSSPNAPVQLASTVKSATTGIDGNVASNILYMAWNSSDVGGSVKITSLDATLLQHVVNTTAGQVADLISVTSDITTPTPVIYVTYWAASTNLVRTMSFSNILATQLAPHTIITTVTANPLTTIASAAQNGILTVFVQVKNWYTGTSGPRSDYIQKNTCTSTGVVGTSSVMLRSVGIGSNAFIINGVIYLLVIYGNNTISADGGGLLQPSYFLSTASGNIIGRLAYANGGGYLANQLLPQATVTGTDVVIGYLYKDLLQAANKSNNPATTNINLYSQTGINSVDFSITQQVVNTAEIGGSLHLTGGMLWQYDGIKPVEHGFNVWPEDITATWSDSGGAMAARPNGGTSNIDQYAYQVTYEWTDAAGNINRSAPSVPLFVTTGSGSGSTGSVSLVIPTLRLTYKTAPDKVRIVVYRWSTGANNQNYYQVTSIASPIINSVTVDTITYVDKLADTAIVGNNLIYTTGGVLENIQAPSTSALTLFKSRLFMIDSENPDVLWFSKIVQQSTPIEMTDFQTLFISPTIGAQGSTGKTKCLAPLDDKLIIFKEDAIYYITGNGPDATGANSDYGDPVFITATVGCANPSSIVFMPNGLMFQSDKGIWLLGRDLSTNYIGAPVEQYNSATVLSANSIPATNQVRFTLDNGITLMYDYYYGQWGTFTGISALASTIYESEHTYIDQYNRTFQEEAGLYLDGSVPVVMSFTTAWLKLAGLQGYQRAYFFYLLGQYISPHKLTLNISYDYKNYSEQQTIVSPVNFDGLYGSDPLYGDGSPYGGSNSLVEQWRIFLSQQRCQAIQISLTETFDSSFGVTAGAGLTLSGLNMVIGIKKAYTTLSPNLSTG